MEIIGYSERGVMNALFYGLTYKNDENGMKALLKLAGVKDPDSFKDFKLYMEFSLSEFGDPDLVIIANKDTERVIIFVEAKVSDCSSYSINKAFQKHAEIIAEENSINGETSNLFFQLRLKHRLFETRNDIPNSEDEYIRKQKKDEPFNKIKMTRVREIEYYRSIGNNPVVRKFVDEIKECQSALYIAIVPEKDEIKDNNEECNKVRKELGEIYFISWQDILNNPSLKQYVGKTISYNQGPDPTIKSKKEKNQILNTPIKIPMDNKEIIVNTLEEISKDSDWETRYAKYAKDILEHKAYHKKMNNKAKVKFPLSKYTSISKFRGKKVETDIRYLGQSIGSLFFEPDKKPYFKKSKRGYNDLAKRYSDIPMLQDTEEWNSRNMKRFRSFLSHIDVKYAKIHSLEHKCENLLLREFHQTNSKKKSLINIQPITFGGEFVQLTTNLSASKKGVVSFSKKGGGIDIMVRARHQDNKVHLGVFELKDENKSNEPMSVVIQQALSYAVFIAKLLDSKGGPDWMKVFGFNKQCPKYIDVVGIIPKGENANIEGEYEVGNYILKTYTLYFDKEALLSGKKFDFDGSYKNILKL